MLRDVNTENIVNLNKLSLWTGPNGFTGQSLEPFSEQHKTTYLHGSLR